MSTSTSSASSIAVMRRRFLVADRRTITGIEPDAVDLHRPGGWNEVRVAAVSQRVVDRIAGLQRGAEHACVGTQRQRLGVFLEAAGQRHEPARTFALRKRSRTPRWRLAAFVGDDPDLEDARGARLHVVLGVGDAAARTHHLHVAGLGAALVAEAVAVGDRALAHVGDDLHVRVRMRRKATLRRDRVVVPHAQRAPAHTVGIVVAGEREMMFRLEPAVVGSAQAVEGSAFNHGGGFLGDMPIGTGRHDRSDASTCTETTVERTVAESNHACRMSRANRACASVRQCREIREFRR